MTDEEKAVIVEKYEDEVSEALIRGRAGSNEFLLPASVLAEKERDHLRRISLLAAGVAAVVGLTDASAILIRHTFSLQLLYLTMLALALLMIVSGLYAGLRIRRRICAEKKQFRFSGAALYVCLNSGEDKKVLARFRGFFPGIRETVQESGAGNGHVSE